MAAHGLTISRQCLALIRAGRPVAEVTRYVAGALDAPGTCFTRGFDMDSWRDIESANARVIAGEGVEVLAEALTKAADTHAWMDAYPTMEAVKMAMTNYVRVGTPYWRVRSRRFDSRDPVAHAKARASIVSVYPLDRRAPAPVQVGGVRA